MILEFDILGWLPVAAGVLKALLWALGLGAMGASMWRSQTKQSEDLEKQLEAAKEMSEAQIKASRKVSEATKTQSRRAKTAAKAERAKTRQERSDILEATADAQSEQAFQAALGQVASLLLQASLGPALTQGAQIPQQASAPAMRQRPAPQGPQGAQGYQTAQAGPSAADALTGAPPTSFEDVLASVPPSFVTDNPMMFQDVLQRQLQPQTEGVV